MGIAVGVRCALTYVRCPFRWPANGRPLPYVLQPKPTVDRSSFSSLQHSKLGAEADSVDVTETGEEDGRERVVILGSGWAGMMFLSPIQTGPRPLLLPRGLGHSFSTSDANLFSGGHTDANLDAQVTFCHADSTPRNTVRSSYLQEPTSSSLRSSTILPPVPSSSAILWSQCEIRNSRENIYKAGPTMSTSPQKLSPSSRACWIQTLAMHLLERDRAI
jgi:hypothetical protein